jgi:small subunit ribosomal protein S1
VGSIVEGTVESLQTYGAFIDLGDGISGLVHVSQISEKRIKSPKAVLSIGDTVKAKVIKNEDGKISLSMKVLNEIAEEKEEEPDYELPESEEISTSLGSLFKNLKL